MKTLWPFCFAAGVAALFCSVSPIVAQPVDSIAVPSTTISQHEIGTRIGIYAASAINMSDPSIEAWRIATGVVPELDVWRNSSTRFTEGSSLLSVVGGITAATPLSRMVHFTGRLGLNWLRATSSVEQRKGADSALSHGFDASALLVELMPGIEVHHLIDQVPLYFLGGLELGLPVSSSHTQSAQQSVSGAILPVRDLTVSPGSIPSMSMRTALTIGAGYTLAVGRAVWLQPEISYRLPLTNVSSDPAYSPWSVGQLRLGVQLTFGIATSSATTSTADDGQRLQARITRISTINELGQDRNVEAIKVQDVTYTEMFPLVPYVFFPEGGSAAKPSEQETSTSIEGGFEPTRLPLDAIEINRNLLNIVGSRLIDIPHATLTITGTTDASAESRLPELGNRRALWTKDYLVNTFGIDPTRVAVRSSARPTRPSAEADPDGKAENRRAELSTNVPDILSPLVISADNQRLATPQIVRFHPQVETTDSIAGWTMTVTQAGRPLREIQGTAVPATIDWSIKPNDMGTAQVPVDYEWTVRTVGGREAFATGSIPVDYASSVQKRTESLPDRTVDKYSLILFDFNTAELSEDNQRVLERMVLPSIRSTSKVNVIGYTDRIGQETYNQRLSTERAQAVTAFLRSRASAASYSTAGVGESSEVFPNASPVGRQLSRTVQVIVETPRR